MPSNFCKSHMPRDDHDVILMGESGQEYTATYSAKQNRLMSGGWKDFSIEHKLQEGDNLDFHMIEPCKFKVKFLPGLCLICIYLVVEIHASVSFI